MANVSIELLKERLPSFESLSELKPKTPNESAGPCPLCGGDDRFFVHDGRGFCRQCREKGGDIVDWHAWKEGTDLKGLLAKYGLGNGNGQKHTVKPKIVKTYDYTDANNKLMYQVCRLEPKTFRQRRSDGNGGFIWNMQGVTPVLYNLPRVAKADEVVIVEGEKDADNLTALGFTATTNSGGAGKWKDDYSKAFMGKRVVVIPDSDGPGQKHLEQVARSLAGAGIEARVIHLPEGVKDSTDYIQTFSDPTEAAERLAILIDGAEPWEPTEEPETEEPKSTLPSRESLVIKPDEFISAELTPPCIVQNYLFCDVGSIVAPGGTGKTTLMLYEMVHIVLNRPLYGLEICRPGWCLYVTAEDERERLVARLREIMAAMNLNDSERREVMAGVCILDVTGDGKKLIEIRDGNIQLTGLPDEIVTTYKDDPPVMVTFDPTVSFGASEGMVNDNEQGLITAARRIKRGLGCCVRYVAHTGKANARNKSTDQYTSRGGSALPDGGRMTAVMQAWQPNDERKLPAGLVHSPESSITYLARPKLSYAPPNLPLIWIKRTGWAFEHVTEIPVSDDEREKALLDQVERFIHSEVRAGHHHSKKSIGESMAQFNIPRATVRGAIERLIAYGRVVMADLPEGVGKGNWKTYLATAKLAESQKNDGEFVKNEVNS